MRAATAALVAATSGLALAGVAAAATPGQIYADLAANGRLDRTYSKSDLARYQHDATIAGYGNKVITITIKPKQQKPVAVVKPTTKQAVAPKQQAPRQVFTPPQRSALPFTGSQLVTFLALGFVFLAGGFLLRMMTRNRSSFR
jgi:hypothetical protein